MNILLVSANRLTAPYPVYPLGLEYVAGAISSDHQVRLADMNTLADLDNLAALITDFNPDVVGLSIRNVDNTDIRAPEGYLDDYRRIAGAVRRACPAPLVLGGSGFTLFPHEMMAALDADYGVVGEGERFARLIDDLTVGQTPTDASIITRSMADVRPMPWRGPVTRRFESDPDLTGFYLRRGAMLNLQTQRGCQFNCIYCTYPLIEGKTIRFADPDETGYMARRLQDAGARFLFITDSVFNARPSHCLDVADAFARHGVSIPWGAFFAPLKPPNHFFERLAAAGLTHVEFGTESLSNAVLTAYGKPFRQRHIIAAHQAAMAAGVHVAHYFLLGGPGETGHTLNETLTCIDNLPQSVLFFFCGMRIYPHTVLHDIACKQGQITEKQEITAPLFYQSLEIDPETIARRVTQRCAGRRNWIFGAGGEQANRVLQQLHARGHTGPLWEYLVR